MNSRYSIFNIFTMWVSGIAMLVLLKSYSFPYQFFVGAIILMSVYVFLKRREYSFKQIFSVPKEDTAYYVAAAVILVPLGIVFEYELQYINLFQVIADKVYAIINNKIYINIIGMAIAGILSICAYPFLSALIVDICKKLFRIRKENIEKYRFLIKPSIIVSVILCLSIITIIRANFVYKDDMQRIVTGYTGYTRESRYLAEYVMAFFEMDGYFADVSPVPQLTGMIIMGITSVLVWHFLTEKKKAGFLDIAAILSFTLTPYFLENVSFKYDSPQHAAATFFAVLPLFYSRRNTRDYAAIVVISSIIMCSFHQAPMGLFPSLVIAKAFIDWNLDKKSIRDIKEPVLKSAISYLAGLLIYRIFLTKKIVRGTFQGQICDNTAILPLNELIPGIFKNYKLFLERLKYDLEPLWIILIIIMCICFIALSIKASKQKKSYATVVTILTFLLLSALSFGSYPLLEWPLMDPRHLYSICYYVGIVSIITICTYDTKYIVPRATAIVMAVSFFMLSIKYGNALYYQEQYTRFRLESAVKDLAKLRVFDEYDEANILVLGNTGYSTEVTSMKNTMLLRLIPTMFNDHYASWCATGLCNQFGLNVIIPADTSTIQKENMDLVEDNFYHSIYIKNDNIIIELKERSDCLWVNNTSTE